jgi:hypothetical protein
MKVCIVNFEYGALHASAERCGGARTCFHPHSKGRALWFSFMDVQVLLFQFNREKNHENGRVCVTFALASNCAQPWPQRKLEPEFSASI